MAINAVMASSVYWINVYWNFNNDINQQTPSILSILSKLIRKQYFGIKNKMQLWIFIPTNTIAWYKDYQIKYMNELEQGLLL